MNGLPVMGAQGSRIPKPFHIHCIISSSLQFREVSGWKRTLGPREGKGCTQDCKLACY